MQVRDLVLALSRFPEDAPVIVDGADSGGYDVIFGRRFSVCWTDRPSNFFEGELPERYVHVSGLEDDDGELV